MIIQVHLNSMEKDSFSFTSPNTDHVSCRTEFSNKNLLQIHNCRFGTIYHVRNIDKLPGCNSGCKRCGGRSPWRTHHGRKTNYHQLGSILIGIIYFVSMEKMYSKRRIWSLNVNTSFLYDSIMKTNRVIMSYCPRRSQYFIFFLKKIWNVNDSRTVAAAVR